MTKANMVKVGFVVLAVAVVLVAMAPRANAQFIDDPSDPTTMHFTCTGTTVCSAGPTFQQTVSQSPTFTLTTVGSTGLSTTNGSVYLVVAVPNNLSAPAFTVTASSSAGSFVASNALVGTFSWASGTRFSPIGVTPSATSDPNINSYLTSAQTFQPSATGFTVMVFYLGDISGADMGSIGINVVFGGVALPKGTVIWTYMTNSNDHSIAINSSPNSSSLLVTPEPGAFSQLLLGLGALACGVFFARTRMGARSH